MFFIREKEFYESLIWKFVGDKTIPSHHTYDAFGGKTNLHFIENFDSNNYTQCKRKTSIFQLKYGNLTLIVRHKLPHE